MYVEESVNWYCFYFCSQNRMIAFTDFNIIPGELVECLSDTHTHTQPPMSDSQLITNCIHLT